VSLTVKDEEYVNQQEAQKLLGLRHATFKKIIDEHGIQPYEFATKRKQIFYLKKALEDLRDTPIEIQPK